MYSCFNHWMQQNKISLWMQWRKRNMKKENGLLSRVMMVMNYMLLIMVSWTVTENKKTLSHN